MPINHHDVAGATQFGGANAGLFTFSEASLPTQNDGIFIRSLVAHVGGSSATWTVYLEDPVNQSKSVILATGSGNDVDFYPAGKYIPLYNGSNANGSPWRLKVVSASKDADGWIECAWEVV